MICFAVTALHAVVVPSLMPCPCAGLRDSCSVVCGRFCANEYGVLGWQGVVEEAACSLGVVLSKGGSGKLGTC